MAGTSSPGHRGRALGTPATGSLRFPLASLVLLSLCLILTSKGRAEELARAKDTTLRFEVTVMAGLLPGPTDGRILVVLDRNKKAQPRRSIGETGMQVPPVSGADAKGFRAGSIVVLNE